MQEFIYYNPAGLDFPLSEKILVTSNIEDIKSKEFLISNSPEVKSELTALEIDFYIRNSQDNPSKKNKNLLELNEIAETKNDFAQDIPLSQEVTNDVLLISSNEEDSQNFISKVKEEEIELFSTPRSLFLSWSF